MNINIEEIEALKKYQENDYKIINMLLRAGINSEQHLFAKFPTFLEELKSLNFTEYLNNIKLIYSAIIKYSINEKLNQDCYRGSSLRTIEELVNNNTTSFMSSSTNKAETIKFSTKPDKNGDRNLENKAFCKIEGNVPFIDLEKILGGGEDEILFAPSNINIEPGIKDMASTEENRYGKMFTIKLSPLEITSMSQQEIESLEISTKLNAKEKLGLLAYILELKQNNNDNHKFVIDKLTKEYNSWKNEVMQLVYQEFEKIKSELYDMNNKVGNDMNFSEHLSQEILDYNEKIIGTRVIDESYSYENGNRSIISVDRLENEDGVFTITSEQIGIGDELLSQSQEMKKDNKHTGEMEFFRYSKNSKSELFFHQINGENTIRIYKNMTGTTLEYYSNNIITNSYEYDMDGQPVFGDPNVPVLSENYIIDYMNAYIPYFHCSSIDYEKSESKKL